LPNDGVLPTTSTFTESFEEIFLPNGASLPNSALQISPFPVSIFGVNSDRHKLSPPWEGPYIVVKVLKPGSYKLANEDGEELTNAWNIQQLRRFYP
jgi:hypothetical protein